LYVIFQLDALSRVKIRAPNSTTRTRQSKSVVAAQHFLRDVVCAAARRMPLESVTAMLGLPWRYALMEDTFHVAEHEWSLFAEFIADVMSKVSLRNDIGMLSCRFYLCQHGLRSRPESAQRLLHQWVVLDHSHVEMVQIHCANEIVCLDGDAVFVNLAGRGRGTLSGALTGPIRYKGKLEKYRVGFLADYGYFAKYCSLPGDDNEVTFVQGYNAAAKMSRPTQLSLLAICVLCRFFQKAQETRIRKVVAKALQKTRDANVFADRYVRDRHVLRLKEV